MKTCSTCAATKPADQFPKGLCCRDCKVQYLRDYRARNAETLRAKKRAKWAARDTEQREAERVRGQSRHWTNHEKSLARGRDYYRRNRDAVLSRHSVRNATRREEMTRRMREWRKANPEKAKAAKVAYYSRMKRLPPWADAEAIVAIYRQAAIMREQGVDCHVDHILPLRGKTVSGLHVHTNLRIIPARENLKKNAKLVEELLS